MRSMICISLLAFSSFLSAETLATSLEEKSVIQSLSYAFDMHITYGESNVYVSVINGDPKTRQVSVINSDSEAFLTAGKTTIDKQSVTLTDSSNFSVQGSAFLVPFHQKSQRNYSNYTLLPTHNVED